MSEPMTDQEIFNKVWEGLKSQGFQRSMKEDYCAYRGDNGFKCAAGYLIPDQEYRPVMEGLGSFSIIVGLVLIAAGCQNLDLVYDLQAAHDANPIPTKMASNLINIATNYSLTVPSQPSLPL